MADYIITLDTEKNSVVSEEATAKGVTVGALVQSRADSIANDLLVKKYSRWWDALSNDDKKRIYDAESA